MNKTDRGVTRLLKTQLHRAVKQWPNILYAARIKDKSEHSLASLLSLAGQIKHLRRKLGLKDGRDHTEISTQTVETAVSELFKEDPGHFIDQIQQEFMNELSGFIQTLSVDLSPERLQEGGIPCGDWSEFEYEIFLRDRLQYVIDEMKRLDNPLSEEMRKAVDGYEGQLRQAIPVAMSIYAKMRRRYEDHPGLYPEGFWWRSLAWEAYEEVRKKPRLQP